MPVLSFPGTTASGSLKASKGHASAKVERVISRGHPTLKLTSAGCGELEQLQVSTSVSVSASTKGGDGGAGGQEGEGGEGTKGSVSGSAGVEVNTSYQLNVSPAEANQINAGATGPNPVDPPSLAPGESIVLNQGTYQTLGLSSAYGVLQGEVN
ncbi:MAG: hypothetical protein ACR2NR_14120 [Solirubrobacteraceae bacterium]